MAQITSITSETLQAKIRELLPSQQGFGEDLQASNVILPTIDLTAAAQGTTTGLNLQTALNFGGMNTFDVQNSTTTIINSPGFYYVNGVTNLNLNNAAAVNAALLLNDGTTSKVFYNFGKTVANSFNEYFGESWNFTIFLRAGDSLDVSALVYARVVGSYRQIADVNGNLVNPVGFTPQ